MCPRCGSENVTDWQPDPERPGFYDSACEDCGYHWPAADPEDDPPQGEDDEDDVSEDDGWPLSDDDIRYRNGWYL